MPSRVNHSASVSVQAPCSPLVQGIITRGEFQKAGILPGCSSSPNYTFAPVTHVCHPHEENWDVLACLSFYQDLSPTCISSLFEKDHSTTFRGFQREGETKKAQIKIM